MTWLKKNLSLTVFFFSFLKIHLVSLVFRRVKKEKKVFTKQKEANDFIIFSCLSSQENIIFFLAKIMECEREVDEITNFLAEFLYFISSSLSDLASLDPMLVCFRSLSCSWIFLFLVFMEDLRLSIPSLEMCVFPFQFMDLWFFVS